ncbi:MAG: CxxxxCH/CxxCH domain-containing protein [Polyangiaceae bacterium]
MSNGGVLARRLALLLAFGVSSSACYDRRNEATPSGDVGRCAACHGDAKRAGDYLQRAAPPRDLSGGTEASFPGVGAHSIHLRASESHAAIACTECHVVPARSDEPGHADHGSPATLAFGVLARHDEHSPNYDTSTRTCQNSYCHGSVTAAWNAPRSSQEACGSCHGLPPALPHPQSQRCSECHGDVLDAQRRFLAPELHVNGHVEFTPGSCTSCHGEGDDPAPPRDVLGNDSPSAIGVGAHRAHLASTLGRSLACKECHSVPKRVEDSDHIQGLPARVRLSGVAATAERSPVWLHGEQTCSDTWCHGPALDGPRSSPRWTDATRPTCTTCHGSPPPAPHPQASECSVCHAGVVASDNHSIIDPERHIDGIVDLTQSGDCTACHGALNPAPPRDLDGNTDTTLPGVGAHQTHVLGTARSRKVPCAECHLVPKTVLAPGHLDSARPAEVVFSGAAVVPGASASYGGSTCKNTACHGALWSSGNASGGSQTRPTWTRVDGTQATCGGCHGLPPPPPHPYGSLNPVCSACHEDIAPDNQTFVHPELHVDGKVTFTVP